MGKILPFPFWGGRCDKCSVWRKEKREGKSNHKSSPARRRKDAGESCRLLRGSEKDMAFALLSLEGVKREWKSRKGVGGQFVEEKSPSKGKKERRTRGLRHAWESRNLNGYIGKEEILRSSGAFAGEEKGKVIVKKGKNKNLGKIGGKKKKIESS